MQAINIDNNIDNNIVDNKKNIKKKDDIDYDMIKNQFNAICKSYNKIQALNDTRKSHIKERIKDSGYDAIITVFEKAEKSDFLKGNITKFKANFDWLMKPSNFIKVLEGNYDNREVSGNGKIGEGSELYRFKTTL